MKINLVRIPVGIALLLATAGAAAQIYKCSLPGERVVYSDRKCGPLESGGRLKITDNLMDSPGSTREADLTARRIARLNQQVQAPYLDGKAADFVKGGRWDGNSETFTIYSPLLGPGMYFDR